MNLWKEGEQQINQTNKMEHDNTNKGVLFKNHKRRNDNDPVYTGSINVDGKDCWLSAWLKDNSKTGEKFMSLSVRPKDIQATRPQPAAKLDDQDDIPF